MGRSQQRKGRGAELELCRVLNDNGIPAEPGAALNYGSVPDIVGVEGVHVEVKRCEQLRLSEWMAQAIRDAGRFGGLPCVFHRRNREEWRVTMPLAAWIVLYKSSKRGCENEKVHDR